jgi:hypothetical protein
MFPDKKPNPTARAPAHARRSRVWEHPTSPPLRATQRPPMRRTQPAIRRRQQCTHKSHLTNARSKVTSRSTRPSSLLVPRSQPARARTVESSPFVERLCRARGGQHRKTKHGAALAAHNGSLVLRQVGRSLRERRPPINHQLPPLSTSVTSSRSASGTQTRAFTWSGQRAPHDPFPGLPRAVGFRTVMKDACRPQPQELLYGLPPQHRQPFRRTPRCRVPAASRRPHLAIRRPGSLSTTASCGQIGCSLSRSLLAAGCQVPCAPAVYAARAPVHRHPSCH